MMYKTLPIIIELRPLPLAVRILSDPAYSELSEAIKQRIDAETE